MSILRTLSLPGSSIVASLLILAMTFGKSALIAGEVLHNGIELPDEWPPKSAPFNSDKPRVPPYLANPPAVIPIDVGRQLFVDDFLIERTTLERRFHQPAWHPNTPVLTTETSFERHGDRNLPFAAPFSDGVWYDPREQVFKMWYMGGSGIYFCYATSRDGLQWNRPNLGSSDILGGWD